MAFGGLFTGGFRPAFDAGAAVTPWYRAGGAPLPVAAYQPKGAASLAASYVNLANPGTYDAAPGTAPTFDAVTGWTGNGSSMYLTTGIIPASGWSVICRFASAGSNQTTVGSRGTPTASTRVDLRPNSGGTKVSYGNGGLIEVAPQMSSGVIAVAGVNAYRDGVLDSSSIPAWSGTGSALFLLALNFAGSPGGYFGGSIQAVAIYNTTLSGPQMAAVSAAMSLL